MTQYCGADRLKPKMPSTEPTKKTPYEVSHVLSTLQTQWKSTPQTPTEWSFLAPQRQNAPSVSFTTPQLTLLHHVMETHALFPHQKPPHEIEATSSDPNMRLSDLSALVYDACRLADDDPHALSIQEQAYVQYASDCALSVLTRHVSADAVRLWLLELAMQPQTRARQCAIQWTLVLSITRTEEDLDQWFQSAVEMMEKLRILCETTTTAGNRPHDWVQDATASLLFFLYEPTTQTIAIDRLRQINGKVLVFLTQQATIHENHQLALDALIHLLVVAVYTHASRTVETNDDDPADLEESLVVSTPRPSLAIPLEALVSFASVDFFRALFFSSLSFASSLRLWTLWSDVALYQVWLKAPLETEDAQRQRNAWITSRFDRQVRICPLLLSPDSLFGRELHGLLGITECFVQHPQLAQTIRLYETQTEMLLTAAILKHIDVPSVHDQWHADIWMAEVLSQAKQTKSNDLALEETCVFDQLEDVRVAVTQKFWSLAKDQHVDRRRRFVRICRLFVQRKLRPHASLGVYQQVVQELAQCLQVLMDANEPNASVLCGMVELVLSVCMRPLSPFDAQCVHYDTNQCENGPTDDISYVAALVMSGQVALEAPLLQQLPSSFFLHALAVLDQQLHPSTDCLQQHCGRIAGPVGDMVVCTAFLLTQSLMIHASDSENDVTKPLERIGGIQMLLPFTQACDTRVATLVSQFVTDYLRETNPTEYYAALRDLHQRTVLATQSIDQRQQPNDAFDQHLGALVSPIGHLQAHVNLTRGLQF